jgi:hypothetical protein
MLNLMREHLGAPLTQMFAFIVALYAIFILAIIEIYATKGSSNSAEDT